ncbi:MAG: hypothetical protein ABWK05_07190 [Pyrobaculum sp.]
MFYVYVNKRKKRVLLTKERICKPEWRLLGAYPRVEAAMRLARFIADARDYVLEWDIYFSADLPQSL